jgi:hypothetical protein
VAHDRDRRPDRAEVQPPADPVADGRLDDRHVARKPDLHEETDDEAAAEMEAKASTLL